MPRARWAPVASVFRIALEPWRRWSLLHRKPVANALKGQACAPCPRLLQAGMSLLELAALMAEDGGMRYRSVSVPADQWGAYLQALLIETLFRSTQRHPYHAVACFRRVLVANSVNLFPLSEVSSSAAELGLMLDLLPALKREDSSVGNPTSSITPAVNLRVC